ncbi:unnamed protein product, partial [Discosporangium mesarthrocarpum]
LLLLTRPLFSVHTCVSPPAAREHGIQQFLANYRKVQGIENDELKWGDEV